VYETEAAREFELLQPQQELILHLQLRYRKTLVLKASKAWGIVSGSDRCPTDPTNVAEIKAWELRDVRLRVLVSSLCCKLYAESGYDE
jgi:hypothetical protein